MPMIGLQGLKTWENRILFYDKVLVKDDELLLRQLGGKNAGLVTLFSICNLNANSTMRVPPGFALTTAVYSEIVNSTVKDMLRAELSQIDLTDLTTLHRAGKRCRDIIYRSSGESDWLYDTLNQGYELLCNKEGKENMAVAVRSSATAEDLPGASFAGQHDSFLNVSGIDELYEATRRCLASVFTDRAISYRMEKNYDSLAVQLSVGVQMMVRSDIGSSGVCFTCDTETGNADFIVINASLGLGESVVAGTVTPDSFMVHKPTFYHGFRAVLHRTLGSKLTKVVYHPHDIVKSAEMDCTETLDTTEMERSHFCLTDEEVLSIAGDALLIQASYGSSVDIEFASDSFQIFIVQARFETVHASKSAASALITYTIDAKNAELQATGLAVGLNVGAGKARILAHTDMRSDTVFEAGEILVTPMTTPDMCPLLKKAAAVITEQGGVTSHASIVCREMGVPAVIGVDNATLRFRDGEPLTVSCCEGSVGRVYSGYIPFQRHYLQICDIPTPVRVQVRTNIGDPSCALKAAMAYNVSGAGLVRMEFVISALIGVHPMALLHTSRVSVEDCDAILKRSRGYVSPVDWYVQKLSEGLGLIAAAFYPKPVVIRFSDHKSSEYRKLIGGSIFELSEECPMLGFRGAARYCHPLFRDAYGLEVQAIRHLRERCGLCNIEVMLPFVRSVEEARSVLFYMHRLGLTGLSFSKTSAFQSSSQVRPEEKDPTLETTAQSATTPVKVHMMVEIPSNCMLIQDFAPMFDGFSIGSNDLAQLTLGMERDSVLLHIQNDSMFQNQAVLQMMKMAIVGARREGKPIGICGEAPASDPELVHWLVDLGISYISVNPSSILPTLRACVKAEHGGVPIEDAVSTAVRDSS